MSFLNLTIDPKLIDVTFQFNGYVALANEQDCLGNAGAKDFPSSMVIPKSEWDDRIREHEERKTAAEFYSTRFTHQGNSHECVCHASTQAFECAYNQQVGLARAVYFSPLALYTRITGGRQWGGSNVMEALYELIERGHIPDLDGPEWLGGNGGQAAKFKVAVHQTSGRSEDHWATKGWIRSSAFPSDWEHTARHFRVLEAYKIGGREEHFSALLRGWVVVNGRQGHSIPHMTVVKDDRGRYMSKYKDSYNTFRYDTEGMTGGGFCIRAVTMPADPAKPAGVDMKQAA